MPTGYTAAIKDGISFEQFVMRCSRAMGAMIMLRDEPMDAPIPDRFEPSDYHVKAGDKARDELLWLKQIPDAEAEREAEKEFLDFNANYEKSIKESIELQAKYESMLANVMEWLPPTTDHVGFKKFMVDQLTDSIKFDCGTDYYTQPVKKSAAEWKTDRLTKAYRDIEYHTKNYQEEVARTESRNKWLQELRASLTGAKP